MKKLIQAAGILALGWATMSATCTIPPPPGTATPTPVVVVIATATLPPATATSAANATPTRPATQALHPPTVDFVNGCNAGDPNSVDPNTGVCEFNIWMKINIPDLANFTPPCDSSQCPQVWRPQSMARSCDHMYTNANAPGGVIDPKTGKWVSIMFYVCSGRLWDFPGDISVVAIPPSVISWTPRTQRPDGYNGTIAGHGQYMVGLPFGAYSCKDVHDLDDPQTYVTGVCQSGTVLLPGAGMTAGPYIVNR